MQAEAALDTLNKKDLGEAKSLKKPPAGVDDVTAVIIILLEGNPKDKSWAAAQKLMNNVDKFLERLKTFKSTTAMLPILCALHCNPVASTFATVKNVSTPAYMCVI